MTAAIRIDVWSDVVCPWCYIGKRRLETALGTFEHAEGELVDDLDTLVRLGVETGLPEDEAAKVLRGSDYTAEVSEDIAQARQFGITGVPFYVLNRTYGLAGAQSADTFRSALRQAHPATR